MVKMPDTIRFVFFGLGMLCIACFLACSGQNDSKTVEKDMAVSDEQAASEQALIAFDTLQHDFGTIIEGEMVVCYFDYENAGKTDLVINSVEATCGCTTPDWNREPLKPGEKAHLKIVFDATGRSGAQRKVVTVSSNASNSTVRLTVKANINNNV